jgi:prefoldin subunit 5
MTVKDKIVFGILVVLILAGGYFQYMSGEMIKRMVILNQNDKEHVDIVQNEFREDLRILNLQFIGRGKHLQKAQRDIVANTNLINATADSLSDMIGEVQYNLDEVERETIKRFGDVETDLADLEDDLGRLRRKTTQNLSEIQQKLTLLERELTKVSDKVFETDKKKKK